MGFTAPIWLWGLVPWAALAAWLMLGRHQPAGVPFLPLWEGPLDRRAPPVAARFHRPPIAVLLALASILLALLAAAGLRPTHPSGAAVTIILDRGLTSSAGSDHPRFVAAAERAARAIGDTDTVELVDPIDRTRQTLHGTDWLAHVRGLPRTAIRTDALIAAALADERLRSMGPILVLTDHAVPPTDDRVSIVGPDAAPPLDVGIIAIAARDRPAAQVMLTLRSHRPLAGPVTVDVASGDAHASRRVDLPPAGDLNLFLDLPSLGDIVEARLSPGGDDALPANDTASLVRTGDSPRIEVRSAAVPEPVRRFTDVFARARPPIGDSPTIAIAADQADLANDAGAIVAPAGAPASSGDVRAATDALTRIVDWTHTLAHAALAPDPPRGQGWTPLVSIGDRTVLARRDAPSRQVWVGFDQTPWSRSPDFVVFWTNALEWLAGPAVQWTSEPVRLLPPNWNPLTPTPQRVEPNAWPGVYRDDRAGRTLAMNAAPADFNPSPQNDARPPRPTTADSLTCSRQLLLAAMLCLLLAALTWRGS